jgi:hypothetical protein
MAKKLTPDQIEALQAGWAWKITRPLHKVEREIQRWQRRWKKRREAAVPPPADAPPAAPAPVAPAVSRGPASAPPPKAAPKIPTPKFTVPTPDFAALETEYRASPLAAEPDTFVLYRILGNDLEPRHRKGQTRSSLGLILAHEPAFESCEKRWVLNRMVDRDEEARIIDLLERSDQPYLRIPFDLEAYGKVGWETRGFPEEGFFLGDIFAGLNDATRTRAEVHARTLKNLYVMNNNGGRNAALDDGRGRAKWVLPFDGNCFLTQSAWAEIHAAVTAQPHLKYFTVPMLRVVRNEDLLRDHVVGPAVDEPQIIFRRDAAERFDEAFPYGRRPKVEMLQRLGVPGPWSGWTSDPWDLPEPKPAAEAGQFGAAGWVGRLESGRPDLESGGNGAVQRGLSRAEAIVVALNTLDARAISARIRPDALTLFDAERLGRLRATPADELAIALRADADAALLRGPYSVTDKPRPAPSGNPHDYLSLARYWWPDPAMPDGRPYQRRDGEDIFASGLPEFAADQFDRERIQAFADDVIMLSLAGAAFEEPRYTAHAAHLVRCWFLDPRTRMSPHLRFGQIVRGRHGDENLGSGVLDLACLAALLDAVRLIEAAGQMDATDRRAFRNWLRAYLDWLHASPQGRQECRAHNNHGTYFDLQALAIGAFLADGQELATTLRRTRERIPHHFAPDGSQPQELNRTRPKHYSHYNLVAWTLVARIAEAVGDDLWAYRTADGRGLERGLAWLLEHAASSPVPGFAEEAGVASMAPLWFAYRARYVDSGWLPAAADEVAPFRVDPLSGLPPYWQLLR